MSPPLACPHCQAVLPPDPPGVLHCGKCGDPYRILGPEELTKEGKKVKDERNLLLIAGGAMFLMYVAPVMVALGYTIVVMLVYLVIFIGMAVSGGLG